jgi:Hypoxia induced protein conserved region
MLTESIRARYAGGLGPAYMPGMKLFLLILLGLDMLAVVAVMLVGALGMANPQRDPRTSNKLMRWRVTLQGVAIGLVVVLLLMGRS